MNIKTVSINQSVVFLYSFLGIDLVINAKTLVLKALTAMFYLM